MKTLTSVLMVLFFLPVSLVFADIIHVPADTATIQGAINIANPGDTVLVAEGRYIENPKISNKVIVLASHFLMDGDTSHISKTIIDGSQPAVTDSATTVAINFIPDNSPVLCGFTITGGFGTSVSEDCREAGGVAVIGSNAIIEHNIITGNSVKPNISVAGGGIEVVPLLYDNIIVIIRDNIIKNNNVKGEEMAVGGGVTIANPTRCENFNFLVEGNTIENNTVENQDVWKATGGGLQVQLTIPNSGEQIIRNNTITRNSVKCEHSFGGGIYVVFVENKADGNEDNSPGPLIYNNIIADNYSDYLGGGVAFFRIYKATPGSPTEPLTSKGKYIPKPAFINNTIVNNTAPDGAGIFTMNHIPFFMNNILWNSYAPDAEWGEIFFGNVPLWTSDVEPNRYGGAEVYYTDIQSGWDGEGNFNSDPMFLDSLNYYLYEQSPCVDAGNNNSIFNDLDGSRNDIGAYGGPHEYHQTDLVAIIESFTFIPCDIQNIPVRFQLMQNYPNPFNPKTVIRYMLPVTCQLDLSIYNILGQKVATLVNKKQPAGSYEAEWDASGFASGVYVYKLETGNGYRQVKKLVLLK